MTVSKKLSEEFGLDDDESCKLSTFVDLVINSCWNDGDAAKELI